MAPHGDDDIYRPQDAVGEGLKGALTGGTFGLFAAAIQNAMAKQSIGALGVFTRSGILITTLAAAIGANQFVTVAASNLREKDDAWSAAAGGAAAGAIAGARVGRMPVIFGLGAGLAVVSATLKFTGGSLAGSRDPNVDHYAQKVAMRENRRRPIEETLAEVGEGRSIRPPGYEERRRQRLKEKYGVEIQTFSADPNAP